MRRPVNAPYTITTEFGVPDSRAYFGRHSGVDYGLPAGRSVFAPASGQLTNVVSPTGGNMVVIYDGQFHHRLMHNSSFSRGNGQVSEGDQVALVGTTGLSTGPHCHWDINKEGTYPTSFAAFIPPADWLAGKYQVTQGGDMPTIITDQHIGLLRIAHSEIGGWDLHEVHAGMHDAKFLGAWKGRTVDELIWAQWNEKNAEAYRNQREANKTKILELQTALTNEQAKPPKEVIKEVTKIVEKPVEVIKTVEVIKEVNPTWLETTIKFIRNVLRIKG